MTARVFDERVCFLGEGPLWHPGRGQLFWFDIVNRTLLTRKDGVAAGWQFSEMVSAAGWIDETRLLISGESGLIDFDIGTGGSKVVAGLDIGKGLRTNDGRADPWGGFWFSSISKSMEKGAGAIYRFFGGRVETLFSGITIPNAICFSPDRRWGYFADTDLGIVRRVGLDAETGAPAGEAETWLDLSAEGLNPDGAVTDAEGNMWLAQWGAGRVAVYDPAGNFLKAVDVGAPHASCPAFGGADFSTLYCTSARQGMDEAALAASPQAGMVFVAGNLGPGRAEPQVRL